MTRANLLAGLAWSVLSILCWAPMFSVAKRTLPHLDAFALATARYLLGVLLLVLLLVAVEGRDALRYQGKLAVRMDRPRLYRARARVDHPRAADAAHRAGAVAIAGVLLVVSKGRLAVPAGSLVGDLLVLAGAVTWVIYTLAAGYFAGWSPLRLTTLTCIPGLAGLMLAHGVAIAAGWAGVPSGQAVASVAWQLAYFSICSVVLGVLGFNNAARRLGPLNTMLMLNVIPLGVFGIEAALGRRFTALELAGAVVVIASLAANNLYLRGVSTRR